MPSMKCRHHILVFILLLGFTASFAQPKIDSLEKVLASAKDTSRVRTLLRLVKEYNNVNPVKAEPYLKEALQLSLSLADSDGMKGTYKSYGLYYLLRSDYLAGIDQEKKALLIRHVKNVEAQDADIYTVIGLCSFKLGRIEPALDMYHKALDIYERSGDEQRMSMTVNNIGSLYYEQERYKEALDFFLRSKKLKEKVHDKRGLATLTFNIATIYAQMDSLPASLRFYQDAMDYYHAASDSVGIAEAYSGMGSDYLQLEQFDKALDLKKKSLQVCRLTGNKTLSGHVFIDIGDIYSRWGVNTVAVAYLDSGLAIAKETQNLFAQVQSYHAYVNHYRELKDYKQAVKYNILLFDVEDSLFNEKNSGIITGMQSRYEAQKKQDQIDLLKKDKELEAVQGRKNEAWLYTLIPGLFLLVLVIIALAARNSTKKRANRELSLKNEQLSQQEKEITDSIEYALSIQQDMLPSEKYIRASLDEFFVLNRPKDIVSGDFYFFERSGDHLIFSAVDCTGHGVPGALLSFLGMDILREAVRKYGLTDPAMILGHLDAEVNQRLRQSTDTRSVRDGMDLALCSLNLKTRELSYAGAFNPLYIISDGKLEEIKSDKHAIGSNHEDKHDTYTLHKRGLKKDDRVYVFSDGYADQFGGPFGKKLKYKPFQNMLLKVHRLPMTEQKDFLDKAHKEWKGDVFQVDDILVIGIRIG
jgi:serine phosphatase RsbU (regulator of sigma subunit)